MKPKSPTLQKLKIEFLEYLEVEKNRSKLTLRNYDLYLRRFVEYAGSRSVFSPAQINLDLVRNFRLQLNRLTDSHGRFLKIQTQTYHIIALRSFLKYLTRRDIKTLSPEKLELPKTPSRQVTFLDSDDLQKLFQATRQEKNFLRRLRDRAIFELLFSTGLRVAEATNLKRSQISLKKDEFSVRGKGDKIRIVFLSENAKSALKQYLEKRSDNSPALFIKHLETNKTIDSELEGKSLSSRSLQRLIKKYSFLAGITHRVTPHTLRHTMATDLLTAGADLRSVQEILGHSSITTTQIYTHITNKRLKEIHTKFHGKFRKAD